MDAINPQATAAAAAAPVACFTVSAEPNKSPSLAPLANAVRWCHKTERLFASEMCQPQVFLPLRAAGRLFSFPRPQNDLSAACSQTFDKYYAPVHHSCGWRGSKKKEKDPRPSSRFGRLLRTRWQPVAVGLWHLLPPLFTLGCVCVFFFLLHILF